MTLMLRATPWLVLLLLFLLLTIEPSYAQPTVGGGGAGTGIADQLLQWFITNVVRAALGLAIIVAGFMMLFGHHAWTGIGLMVVGVIIISQWQNILQMIGI